MNQTLLFESASGAVFSSCRKYRYTLWRIWDEKKPHAMFIGLNPSTADEVKNDPTVRRCIGYAQDWGYGGLMMTNIFAFRATDPKVMKAQADPVGPENNKYITEAAKEAGIVVAAWGNHGKHMNRGAKVHQLIPMLRCLGLSAQAEPLHPLYLAKSLKPIIWSV